jgi:hypothetical protein
MQQTTQLSTYYFDHGLAQNRAILLFAIKIQKANCYRTYSTEAAKMVKQ